MNKLLLILLGALFLAFLVGGCVSVPPIDPDALPPTATAFKEAGAAAPGTSSPAPLEWWTVFRDRVLDNLEKRATRSNTSAQVAAAKLAQARALAEATDSRRGLQADALGGASRARDPSSGGDPTSLGAARLVLGYEIDLFGRLAEATRAATLDAAAAEALLAAAHLQVQAEVAQAYFAIRALDTERQIVRDTIDAYRGSLALTERRHAAGDIAELDVVRVRNEVAATEAEAFTLDRRRAELEHALAVLVGEPASAFGLGERDWATALPAIPAGIPSTVLARRPDVAAAHSAMLAAQSRVGVAQSAWLPAISLTASGGHASSELTDLFKWSARAWGASALLALPLLDGGRRAADVDRSRAELDAALAAYREQVLLAFRDVEDQLAALRLLALQADAQQRAVGASNRATALSDVRYRNGYVSQLELLDAQRTDLRNRRQAVQVRAMQYQATIGLVRALGGGWD